MYKDVEKFERLLRAILPTPPPPPPPPPLPPPPPPPLPPPHPYPHLATVSLCTRTWSSLNACSAPSYQPPTPPPTNPPTPHHDAVSLCTRTWSSLNVSSAPSTSRRTCTAFTSTRSRLCSCIELSPVSCPVSRTSSSHPTSTRSSGATSGYA